METGLPLKGTTALITGGVDVSGIGTASAAALLRDGATVLLMGRRRDALERNRQQLQAQVPNAHLHICAGDVSRASDMQAALKQAWWLNNRLDVVVPTVGADASRHPPMHDEAGFRTELELRVVGAFTAIRLAAPWMARQGGGSIVCIASGAARTDSKRLSAPCTVNACLDGLVCAAAQELAPVGIRVNAVRPTRPEDTAAAVRYLAGPESAWVTGQSLAADGVAALRMHPEPDGAVRHFYGEATWRAIRATQVPTAA